MMIQKFMPSSATHTKVHYEVYRNKESSEEDFRTIADTYARVMKEDKALCDRAQANLNAGVFVNGELHPRWEKGTEQSKQMRHRRDANSRETRPSALPIPGPRSHHRALSARKTGGPRDLARETAASQGRGERERHGDLQWSCLRWVGAGDSVLVIVLQRTICRMKDVYEMTACCTFICASVFFRKRCCLFCVLAEVLL